MLLGAGAAIRLARVRRELPVEPTGRGLRPGKLRPLDVEHVALPREVLHAGFTVARGPMYVQWESPVEGRRPYPLVLIHGGGGQGLDWLGTPDGRPGWATYLVQEGYTVYVVDSGGVIALDAM